jgi:eukaryotic-like serine/threonine-protein kinase
MGSILAAEDRVLGRRVAVKLLAEQFASQPLFVTRFEREARTAAALSGHPNVIRIYDVGEHDGRPFIVMEYLPGGTLRDRLAAGAVPRADLLDWLGQAAAGLDFAHDHGVVHRDVKPRNLLFDSHGRLVVADLGIARAAYEDSVTSSGELLGTASYSSPEQAMGEPATAASDRYSLAVVAYELLTGTRPFGGTGFAEQALQQIESSPDPPSTRAQGLGPAVDRVLLKGLAKDPGARHSTAGGFVSALAGALDRPAGGERLLLDPGRASHARPAAVAAVLIALVAVAGVVVLGSGGDNGSPNRVRHGSTAKAAKQPAPRRKANTAPAAGASATPVAGSGPALNAEGYGLMQAGRYGQAVPVLQRAVAAFPRSTTDLTYAYALYNLGRSLRLSGRAADAIPVLQRRLRFANQRDVVRHELAAARSAVG